MSKTKPKISDDPDYHCRWDIEDVFAKNEFEVVSDCKRHGGACYGMSLSWLKGILKYKHSFKHMPDLERALEYQHKLLKSNMDKAKVICGAKKTDGWLYRDRSQLVKKIWVESKDMSKDRTGYIFGMMPEAKDKTGHACAFIRYKKKGFIMLPNAGLYECSTPEALGVCMLKDKAFRRLDRIKCDVYADSFKW